MSKKIYVLRNGDNPGIYLNWLDFFQRIDGRKDVEYKIITYNSELEDADESVLFSMKWAFKVAREFLATEKNKKNGDIDFLTMQYVDKAIDILMNEEINGEAEMYLYAASRNESNKKMYYDKNNKNTEFTQRQYTPLSSNSKMKSPMGSQYMYGNIYDNQNNTNNNKDKNYT